MEWTWIIIMGISIRVGIDVARYAALRANRRSEREPTIRQVPVAVLSATPLVCQRTLDENTGRLQPKITMASRRGRQSRAQSRAARAAHHEFVN